MITFDDEWSGEIILPSLCLTDHNKTRLPSSSLVPLALQPTGVGRSPDTFFVSELWEEFDSEVDWLGVGLVMSIHESAESSWSGGAPALTLITLILKIIGWKPNNV